MDVSSNGYENGTSQNNSTDREPHRKKDSSQYNIFKWTDKDMGNAIDAVMNTNVTVGAASKLFKVPKGTLQSIIDNPGRKLRLPHGRKPKIEPEAEESLRKFCGHSWGVGVPRTQQMLGLDITDFSNRTDCGWPFKEKPPGDYYFKRFCITKEGKIMPLPTKAMVDQDLLRQITVKEWSDEVKEYIKVCNEGNLLQSLEHFFLLQAYVFDISQGEDTRILTIGNPVGGLVKQIVIAKDGTLDEETTDALPNDMTVYFNETGWFDLESIDYCMDQARGYLQMRGLEGKAMLYLDQNLRRFYKYLTWLNSIESNFVLNFPPRCIFREMQSRRLGMTTTYRDLMCPKWIQKNEEYSFSCTEENFLALHLELTANTSFDTEIAKTFNTMKMCHVVKPKKPTMRKRNSNTTMMPETPEKKRQMQTTPTTWLTPCLTRTMPNIKQTNTLNDAPNGNEEEVIALDLPELLEIIPEDMSIDEFIRVNLDKENDS